MHTIYTTMMSYYHDHPGLQHGHRVKWMQTVWSIRGHPLIHLRHAIITALVRNKIIT